MFSLCEDGSDDFQASYMLAQKPEVLNMLFLVLKNWKHINVHYLESE